MCDMFVLVKDLVCKFIIKKEVNKMNKPVSPWKGTMGLHKEEKAVSLPSKMTKGEKKGVRKVAVRLAEAKKKTK